MYHQTDVNLIRDITFVDEVGNNEIEKTVICQDCDSKEKNKKETLEEVAEKYASYDNDYVQLADGEHDFNEEYKNAFINGAKWQQERDRKIIKVSQI
jgi:hypothetical protein